MIFIDFRSFFQLVGDSAELRDKQYGDEPRINNKKIKSMEEKQVAKGNIKLQYIIMHNYLYLTKLGYYLEF